MLAKVQMPRRWPPSWHLADKLNIDTDAFANDPYLVCVQVAAEVTLVDADVALLLARSELFRRCIQHQVFLRLARPVKVDRDQRRLWALGAEHRLGVESDHHRRPVIQMRVEIPPLIAPMSPGRPHAVLPGGNLSRLQPKARIVLL